MSEFADFDIKERVRQASDIVDIVGSYLDLRRQGSNFVAICPWHDDHKPSLQINPSRQTWKCWPCDLGGDVFSFIQQQEGVGFREALTILADRAGIQMRQMPQAKVTPGSPQDKTTLFEAMAWAERQFREHLREDSASADARRYLAARGINEKCIEHFGVGYSPDSWTWLMERADKTPFSNAVLEACGLLSKSQNGNRHYCPFRGRVMFPIRDIQERVIAFGGRVLPEVAERMENETGRPAAKYYNSPETRLFTKSDNLYGLNFFRSAINKQRHMVIVEGYTDVIAAWQAGLDNVVAVLGTALNQRHIRLIRRYADRVTLVLDGDHAGVRRANEILEQFVEADLDLRIMTLPDEMDPFDFLQQKGAGEFRNLLAEAPDALDHKIQLETQGIDLIRDTHESNRALENVLSVLARSPRKNSSAMVRFEQMLNRMSHLFGIELDQLRQRLQYLAKRGSKQRKPNEPEVRPALAIEAREKELLQILCQDIEFLDAIVENISPDQFVPGPAREIYELYCDCFHHGRDASFLQILTLTENPELKKILVSLDEEEQRKRESMEFDPRKRLDDIFRAFDLAEIEANQKEAASRLHQEQMDDAEETDALLELLEQTRRRQGL